MNARNYLPLIASALLIILFSGCITLKSAEECEGLTASDVVDSMPAGQNLIHTDETVVMKANMSCWHEAALGYITKGDETSAVQSCGEILYTSSDASMGEIIWTEYASCISDVADRSNNNQTCEYILAAPDADSMQYTYHRCQKNATPPANIASGCSLFILMAGGTLFFAGSRSASKRKNQKQEIN